MITIRSIICAATMGLFVLTGVAASGGPSRTSGPDYKEACEAIDQLEQALKAGQTGSEVVMAVLDAGIRLPEGLESRLSDLHHLLGPTAVPILIEALKNPSASMRAQAAHALGGMETRAKTAMPMLIGLLRDPSDQVRFAVSFAIGRIDAGSGTSIPPLVRALRSENPDERSAAAHCLDILGTTVRSAIPEVVASLGDPDEQVRYWLVNVLGNFDAGVPPVLPTLIRLLGMDPSAYVRERVARELWEMGVDNEPEVVEAIPSLTAALLDPSADVAIQAAKGLRVLGPKAGVAARQLEMCSHAANVELAQECQHAYRAVEVKRDKAGS